MRKKLSRGTAGLPERLSCIRSGVGLTQAELVAGSGIGAVSSFYEHGEVTPSLPTVAAMAKVLGVDPSYLAFGDDSQRGAELVDSLERLGGRLLVLRKLRGFTYRRLAAVSGVSVSTILTFEKSDNTHRFGVAAVERLARALDVSPGVLAFGAREEE